MPRLPLAARPPSTGAGPVTRLGSHLSDLRVRLGEGELRGDAIVTGVTADSRRVTRGDLFLAVCGSHADGHRYAWEAVEQGARALVVEHFLDDVLVPQLRVPSVPAASGVLAAHVYNWPSERMPVVGVTGTNGKTTTSQLVQACMAGPSGIAGQIGTTGTYLGNQRLELSALSTPEAPDLQRHLFTMLRAGAEGVAVEVTSHALDHHRVDGTHFRVAVFLNLSPEHLDHHGSMERYFAVKSRLFEPSRCDQAVVCVDSEWGARLAATCRVPVTTFSLRQPADVVVTCEPRGLKGIVVALDDRGERLRIASPLVGPVNAANVAAAYLSARALGIGSEQAVRALEACPAPPGRFEVVSAAAPYLVAIDYAHTPEALAALIETARSLATAKVHIVLGARGERYADKRPEMARVASRGDAVTITTDSPGDEDPLAIIDDMLAGVAADRRSRVRTEPDREVAIRQSVQALGPGDVLLITGRGHETTQRFGERVTVLDDRVTARLALAALPGSDAPDGEPRVSVVIPAHNAEQTLAAAIGSVLSQTVPPDEVIVVDDGSEDGTARVARSFGEGVRLVEQPCLGPSAARNAGVAMARSPLVAFLDADDVWQDEKLERQVAAMAVCPAVLCASDWVRDEFGPLPDAPSVSTISTDDLLVLNRFQTSTVVVRRDAFARVCGFSPGLDGAEDWDLWLRLSRLGPVIKVDAPLVRYRDVGTGYSKDLRRHHDAVVEIVRRELVGTPGRRSRTLRAWHHLRFAVAFSRLGDRSRARECLALVRRERLLAAAVPASTEFLLPFLADRVRRRLPIRGRARGAGAASPGAG